MMRDVEPHLYATVIREMIRHENDATNHRSVTCVFPSTTSPGANSLRRSPGLLGFPARGNAPIQQRQYSNECSEDHPFFLGWKGVKGRGGQH
jgi:hypothetical protein